MVHRKHVLDLDLFEQNSKLVSYLTLIGVHEIHGLLLLLVRIKFGG